MKNGGGLQVADSVCRQLKSFPRHYFVVILSSYLRYLGDVIHNYNNVTFVEYDMSNAIGKILYGRDKTLDRIVKIERIDAVLTIFGPSKWIPRCPHLSGFARAQLLLKNSPHYSQTSIITRLKYYIWTWAFRRSGKYYYTENSFISENLPSLVGNHKKVYTVTNYYNQVFDNPREWKYNKLPFFNGYTILTISSGASHKNLPILERICEMMKVKHPDFDFRFVLTRNEKQCQWVKEGHKNHFIFLGKVDINECPSLYAQANIMFMPTLLECFTATYPEAMRMEVPIVTTDLEFAHGLCGDAACYYSAVDAEAAAEAIYKVATDKEYAHQLTENGKKQLLKFDNYEQRAEKLIHILEEISKESNII